MTLRPVLGHSRFDQPHSFLAFTTFLLCMVSVLASTSLGSGPVEDEVATQDVLSLEPQLGINDAPVRAWGVDENGFYVNDFNATACAELHNQIVALVSRTPNQPKHTLQKFFDVYAAQDEELRSRLSDPLLDFLSRIHVPVMLPGKSWPRINFTPRLAQPAADAFWLFEDWELGDEYILLYPDEGGESTGGIFFDMEQNLVCMLDLPGFSVEDCSWHYLETALTRYLEQFQVGKFGPARPSDDDNTYEVYDSNAIVVRRIDGSDLETALGLYDSLLQAIAEHLDGAEILDEPLVDMETLVRWGIQGFAFEFLSRAKTPSFKYIAPGVTVFNSITFNSMMELNNGKFQQWVLDRGMEDMAPMLVFPGDALVQLDTDDEEEKYLFNLSHQYLINNMTGVYLQTDWDWSDAIRFVLPYSIGQNGHIHYGSRPDEPVRGHSVLYQHGPCPFFKGHNTRLFSLLYNWVENVRSGAFSVGPDGVEGGMELYQQVDAEDSPIKTDVGVCW
ncbi:hypothetical protein VKT23_009253 [Stygiomarasmius scandens]|uniref:Uncharacterized protein n=1 Tax=Marasmiellus scandens TaxID=2682957 RepID=A0ABR1JI79_9AGAR